MNLPRSLSPFALVLISLIAAKSIDTPRCDAQEVAQRSVTTVPPGTIVVDEQAESWNRVILLATPRIASGDVNKLSEGVRSAVPKLTLTILATVQSEKSNDTEVFRLKDIGIAYSALADNRLLTVTTDTAPRLGAKLDFFSRQMLSENEKQLATVKLVVRTPTLSIFDAPAIMLRDQQHKDFITRHLVWIDARTGKLAFVVWLLNRDTNNQMRVSDNSLRVVAPGTREDRKIHIDGRSFFLGIPSARAFALEDLPPGLDVQWNDEARQLATRETYDEQSIQSLATALNAMLTSK